MNGAACNAYEDYKPPRKPQLPEQHPRRRLLIEAAWCVGALVLVVCLYQYARGVIDEYDGMVRELVVAEARATDLQKQLDLALRHGADGILVANIGADLAGWQVRLVPAPRQFRGRD